MARGTRVSSSKFVNDNALVSVGVVTGEVLIASSDRGSVATISSRFNIHNAERIINEMVGYES
jgi:hypothetical protein